jgi:hypothetical protein
MNTILAIHSQETVEGIQIIDSDGRTFTSNDIRLILIHIAKLYKKDQFIIAWDLTSFLTPLYKLLPPEIKDRLNNGERAIWYPFRLFYSVGKGKFLGINYKERILFKDNIYSEFIYDIIIYELKTFFPGYTPPGTVHDTCNLGRKLLAIIEKMGFRPSKLTSPAAIYEESILSKIPMPTIYTMPAASFSLQEWCMNYIREWRSVYKIGIWNEGEAFDYDLSSAYPSLIAMLPNLYNADFIHTDGDIPQGIIWGMIAGKINITGDISPIVAFDGTCRKGTYFGRITLEEWHCLKRWGIGDIQPSEGWFIKVPVFRPLFEYPMKRLYLYRVNSKDDVTDHFAKICANSVWGKFQEMHGDKYGDYCNFIYACMVASRCRIKVCDFIYENNLVNDLISVTVDGLIASKFLPDVPNYKTFGGWRINPPSAALVLTSSHQWVGDKKPNGKTVHEMLSEIKAHPKAKHYGGIAFAMLEHDRYFKSLPKNGRDLLTKHYDSIPFTAEEDDIENISD